MAYRTGQPVDLRTTRQLCAGCGAAATSTFERDLWVCAACKLEQPSEPDGEVPAPSELTVLSHQPAKYRELSPYAETLGLEATCSQLSLRCDGVTCRVTLSIDSGVVRGVDLDATTTGLPPITLTRETSAEVEAKASALTREVQTGDPEFDRAVFVDSAATDADVLTVLSSPRVRAAIRLLLTDHRSVALGPEGVRVRGERDRKQALEPEALARAVAALRVVAGARRPLEPATVGRSLSAKLVLAYVYGAMPIGLPALVLSLMQYTPAHASFVVLPLVAGVLIALVAQPFLPRLVRGRSSSHADLRIARIGVVTASAMLAVALAVGANGLLDESAEREDTLEVDLVSRDTEEDTTTVITRGGPPDLQQISVTFDDPGKKLQPGDTVTIWTRRGALGGPWHTRPAIGHGRGGTVTED